jgi:hypothetical protein
VGGRFGTVVHNSCLYYHSGVCTPHLQIFQVQKLSLRFINTMNYFQLLCLLMSISRLPGFNSARMLFDCHLRTYQLTSQLPFIFWEKFRFLSKPLGIKSATPWLASCFVTSINGMNFRRPAVIFRHLLKSRLHQPVTQRKYGTHLKGKEEGRLRSTLVQAHDFSQDSRAWHPEEDRPVFPKIGACIFHLDHIEAWDLAQCCSV